MNIMSASENTRQSNSRKFKLFCLYGMIVATGIAAIITALIVHERKNKIEIIKQNEILHLETGAKIFHQELDRILRDLVFLSNAPCLRQIVSSPDNESFQARVVEGLALFLATEKTYDQVRYIDEKGMETVRVNYKNGEVEKVQHEELQNKSNRYYFSETMRLEKGQIYISPFDLNKEHGQIEIPYKPMLRIATPLFDTADNRRGILIFNYFGQHLIDLFHGAFHHHDRPTAPIIEGSPIILNNDGYWLHSLNPADEWGFMLGHQKRFADENPFVWKMIEKQKEGQVLTPNGLFSFLQVYPLAGQIIQEQTQRDNFYQKNDYYWILAAHISTEKLSGVTSLSKNFPWLLYFFVLTMCGPFLWFFVSLKEENRKNLDALAEREKKISHLNLVMQTINKIHQTIIIERSVDSLVKKICNIFIANRGYYTAWIMLTDQNNTINTIVQSGFDGKFVKMEEELQEGRLSLCINKVMDSKDIITISGPDQTCSDCFLRKNYKNRGVISGPLRYQDTVYGYVTVTVPLFFLNVNEEKDLFNEIINDIAYAIYSLHQDEKRKIAENNLYESEQRFKTLVNNIPQRIFHKDQDSVYVACNSGYAQDIGIDPDHIIGKTDYDFFTTELAKKYHADDQEIIQKGTIKNLEEELVVNGVSTTVQTIKMPFIDKQGQSAGILGVYWDISAQKKTAEQLLQTEKMSTIAGLAAGVAHEINTPLSAIMQSAQLVSQRLLPDMKKNIKIAEECGIDLNNMQEYFRKRELDFFLEGIHNSAINAAKIISNLLQFSRPHSNEFTLVNLNEITDNALELAKTDFDLNKNYDINNINFMKEYGTDLSAVFCVKMEIEQVVINLIKNCIQAMGASKTETPTVTIRTSRTDNLALIEIEDNGPGIDEDTRLQIFDPFFTTKDIGEGTGLGLYVCHSIVVDKHKGNVLVDSTPGQGATFIVELPLCQETEMTYKDN